MYYIQSLLLFMSVVKLKQKEELDQLVATLTLRLGRKVSLQSVLDASIKLSSLHIDELEAHFSDKPHLSKSRVKEILDMAEEFKVSTKGSLDEDIYGK